MQGGARVLTGNKHSLPAGMSPQEWAARVFALMDEGLSQDEAKRRVSAEAVKAFDAPPMDKQIRAIHTLRK